MYVRVPNRWTTIANSPCMKMSVPPRWINCPRKGQIIAGEWFQSFIGTFQWRSVPGKFLPFKTPLSSRYDAEVPEDKRFDVAMLVSYVESLQLRLGLVVDLTKTDRFYDKRSLAQFSICHHKLQCEGYAGFYWFHIECSWTCVTLLQIWWSSNERASYRFQ